MNPSVALAGATVAIAFVCVALLAFVIGVRVRRLVRGKAHAPFIAQVRGQVLELIAGDEEWRDAKDSLTSIDTKRWRAAEPSAIAFLGKLRGHPHAQLVEVLDSRGTIEREVGRLTSRIATRRARAASLLGAARWSPAVDQINGLLRDGDRDVRVVAAGALGRIGDPSSAAALFGALRAGGTVPWSTVTNALVQLKEIPPSVLSGALDDLSPQVRSAAAFAVGSNGIIGAAAALTELVDTSEDVEVRAIAARALGQVGTARSQASLIRAAGSDQPRLLRRAAVEGLAGVGTSEALECLADLCSDPDHLIAMDAGILLWGSGPAGRAELDRVGRRSDPPPAAVAVGARAALAARAENRELAASDPRDGER